MPQRRPPATYRVALLMQRKRDVCRQAFIGFHTHNWLPDRMERTAVHGDPFLSAAGVEAVRPDGVVGEFMTARDVAAVRRTRAVAVDITNHLPGLPFPQVLIDNRRIGELAAEYLLDRGYRRMLFVGPRHVEWAVARWHAFRLASGTRSGCRVRVAWTHATRLDAHERAMLRNALTRLPKPCAVFAANDVMGAAVLEIAVTAGISVPDEVAVLGVDNEEIFCAEAPIPLSSINVNFRAVGERAAAMLHDLLRGRRVDTPVLIPPHGVQTRQSTDSSAVSDPSVGRALQFIGHHLSQPLGVDGLAQQAGMSRRCFEVRFRRAVGCSPHAQIIRVRVSAAKELLRSTGATVDHIAERVGFSQGKVLHRHFRRITGRTPAAYRREFASPA